MDRPTAKSYRSPFYKTPVDLAPVKTERPAFDEETQAFIFDQYDGSSLGFYVEIEAPSLGEAKAILRDLVSEQETLRVPLGTVKGKAVEGRITFHPSGVRPTYFRNR